MPHWEDELRALLQTLGVSLEENASYATDAPNPADADDMPPDALEREWENQADDDDPDEDQFAMIRREMEATLHEVARLAQSGQMAPELRDDVVHVLRALTTPPPVGAADIEEWRYTSAAAVLHFCRLILRLAHALAAQE
jgi:hypothetical protein